MTEDNVIKNDSTTEMFDELRQKEEAVFLEIKKGLGSSFDLISDVLRLYDTFIQLSLKAIWQLDDMHRPPALMHSLQWIKNEAIAGTMTLMRGHITDSSNYSRRSLELCAFIIKFYQSPEAAKCWMDAGNSKRARERYESTFPAFQLVREHLTAELIAMYEDDCLDVHPSFFAVAKRASLGEDRVHRFSYFDLDEVDEAQTSLLIEFLNLVYCHARIMEHLATVFNPSGCFSQADWLKVYVPFIEKFKTTRDQWRLVIDEHFAVIDAQLEAEANAEREEAKARKQAKKESKQRRRNGGSSFDKPEIG